MMDAIDVLREAHGRIADEVRGAVDGLTVEQLTWRPSPEANPIAWLVWHLARVQDHHVAEIDGEPQEWATGDWAARFGLDPDPTNTGYGHDADDVAAVQPDGASALLAHYEAAAARTSRLLDTLSESDLDRVVDERWSPPVTLGVRLVSIIDDGVQHAGQAAYVRGLLPS